MNSVKLIPSLLVFAEVANQQSFTGAAKHLGMSKSAISQQISRLESDIGQQLLSRNTRGMSLTAAGKRLLGRCELLKDQVNLALDEINDSREEPSGSFALTIPHSCEKSIVIPALRQLCIEFPKIEPELLVTDTPTDLIQNKLDVSIYGGELKDSNYRALPIGTCVEVFCATPAYVQKYGQPEYKEDLTNHRVIGNSWQTSPLPVFKNNMLAEKELIELRYFAKTNTLPSALEMVSQDMGISLLPEFVVQTAIQDGQLVRVLNHYRGSQWPFYMVHRFHGDKPVHISRFYQLIKLYFSKANSNISQHSKGST
ncbi:LysR family transcriptional regulator [Litoribacillus peritrichatus]|uniref:LysR family transcriptional regulator n=1 Tax=Litoribacillus peritrichatus TaxID=718191 RepID=A0ABP7MH00_9GAMM